MTKEAIIQKTIETLEKLPSEKINEVSDFADFILKKYEEQLIQKRMEKIVSESEAFSFLHEEEDLYEEKDLMEKY